MKTVQQFLKDHTGVTIQEADQVIAALLAMPSVETYELATQDEGVDFDRGNAQDSTLVVKMAQALRSDFSAMFRDWAARQSKVASPEGDEHIPLTTWVSSESEA